MYGGGARLKPIFERRVTGPTLLTKFSFAVSLCRATHWNPFLPFNVEKLPTQNGASIDRGNSGDPLVSADRVGEKRQPWLRRASASFASHVSRLRNREEPLIFDPGSYGIRQWNKVFVCSCLAAAFLDPLFFFLPIVDIAQICVEFDWQFAVTLTVLRSLTDLMYLLYILVHFRLAYTAPGSKVFGRGELVRDPKKIARRYLTGNFALDVFAMLPLPQLVLWAILTQWNEGQASTGNYSNYLRLIVAIQYIPRIIQVLPVQAAVIKPEGVVFETAWSGFVINLAMFLLAAHVIGSVWYVFGLERIDSCWHEACQATPTCTDHKFSCNVPLDSASAANISSDCNDVSIAFNNTGFFDYGIYQQLLLLIQTKRGWENYLFSFWWGLQQICSFGNNLMPSSFVGESILCIIIAVVGLVLFALLVGNIQTFLQSLSARLEEMRLQGRDTELWMKARQLPGELRHRVRKHDRYTWEATSGVDEEGILEQLPEDLRRDIKRHLCIDLVRKVPLFGKLDENALDAVCERLKPRLYIQGSTIYHQGDPVTRMLFIMSGKLESITSDGDRTLNTGQLHPGDFAGEELLTWCLDSRSREALPKSTRLITALSPVEAFYIDADDLKYITTHFRRLHSKEIQHALRYYSQQWRDWAATSIQCAWRRYKRRQAMRAAQAALHESGTYSIAATRQAAAFLNTTRRASRRSREPEDLLRKPAEFP